MVVGIGSSAETAQTAVAEAIPPSASGVLDRIARLALSAPRRMLAVAALVALTAGIFGVPVAKSLCACGFEDPSSESAQAKGLLTDKFGVGDVQLVIVVSAPNGADGAAARAAGTDLVQELRRSPHVASPRVSENANPVGPVHGDAPPPQVWFPWSWREPIQTNNTAAAVTAEPSAAIRE